MKKIFTKTFGFVAAIILFVGIALPAHAQFVKKTYESNNEFYTAVTKDPNGNIYAIRSADGVHASVIKYAPNSTSFTTLFSGLAAGGGDESNGGFLAWGLAVNSHGDVYCTTNLSTGNTSTGTNVVNGSALTNHGNVIKLASNNGYNGTVYTASVFLNGGLYYTSLAFDSSDNLYVVQTDDISLSHYIVKRYAAGTTSGTQLFNDLNDDATDNYPHGIAVASNGDIYVCDAGQLTVGGTSGHKGGVRHYVNSGGTYSSHTNVSLNTYAKAVELDGSGNLYISETDGTAYANYRLNKYNASTHALTAGNITTALVASGGVLPDGIAAVSSSDIYVLGGGNPSEFFELIGPATTPASGLNFTSTATTTTTINWTNGDGASRAVFVAQASTGTPTPANSTNYTASTTFGSGTQAGSGWYCVYNGTGTSVNVTGLTAGTTYRAMVVEYNGSVALTSENYLTTSNSGNTANVTTQSPTTINSINRVTATPSNLATVNFSAVFGAAVTGVTASNFSLTTTGVSGASIGTPTTSDNITWTVPVSTGTGDGTIQLNLANATGLSKTISTPLPFSGQSYTIDKTAPTISIGSPSLSATNSGPVTYTVTYADANFNSSTLANGNITLNATGTASGTPNVTGSGLTRTVTISGITGNGTLGISVAAGTATDLAGNSAPSAGPSTTFTVDNTAPTVAITRSDSNPIHDNVLDFQAVFSEPVTGVDQSDFTMTNAGVTTGAISLTPINSTTYNITVINVVGNGTARLDLNGSGTGITDAVGNAPAGFTGGEVYNVDQTAPGVTSINRVGTTPTNATSLDYTVTFSESVTGVDASDFSVTGTGSASGTVSAVTGSGTTYTVTVNSISGNGTLRLDLNGGTDIQDAAGNSAAGYTSGQTYSIDNTAPTANNLVFASNHAGNQLIAAIGDVITLSFTTSEAIQAPTVSIAGHSLTATNTSGNDWVASYTMTSGDTEGRIPFSLQFNDNVGNAGALYNDIGAGDDIEFDKTAPTISISAPSQAIIGSGTAGTVTYTVTYADANFNSSTLGTGDITLNSTGTANATVGVSNAGTTSTITLSSITGLGTLGISIAAGTASDAAGNLAPAAGPSTTFTVASTDPTLSALTTDLRKVAPNFNPAVTTGYTTHVPYTATSTAVIATPVEAGASVQVQVNGGGYTAAPNGSASSPLALNPGDNTIDVLVTAPDQATTKTYTITTTRAHSSFLSTLTYSPPSLKKTKVSGSNYVDYTATVDPTVTEVSVTPVAEDPSSVITVNGTPVASGATSSPITLVNGPNTINTVVTTSDGLSTRTYSIVVTRQADALLTSLTYNPGLTAHKATGTHDFDYTATVYNSSITVLPVAEDPAAAITVNGTPVTSGTESAPIALALGPNTITTVVTATDGVTTKTYSMVVTRQANALLSMLSFSPPSLKKVKVAGSHFVDYIASVDYHVTEVLVTPTVQDPTSTVTVNGVPVTSGTASDPIALVVGDNTINTEVTAADGTTKNTYSIVVTRRVNANLSSLTFNPGLTLHLVSGSHDVDYIAVANNSSITVTPTVEDPAATVTVNGTPVTSGTASGPIALTIGDNTINTVVTASDGTTTKTYSTVVTRQANALLATLVYSPASIKKVKVSGPDYADYTATVANSISWVTVTPTVQDPTSTVKVNGITVASGATSDPIALAVGDNTINTVVTAEDGTTTNTYSIVITRQVPSMIMAYQEPKDLPAENAQVVVHQNVSPNGDGRSDGLVIEGIAAHPDNKLQIMSRSGALVYEAKGYDNNTKVFDGHANNGKLQQAGTYFYSLEYKDGNETKHKTGFIVLKY